MSASATAQLPGLRATPAELRLAGGEPEATVTLQPLLNAAMRGPRGRFERAEGPAAS